MTSQRLLVFFLVFLSTFVLSACQFRINDPNSTPSVVAITWVVELPLGTPAADDVFLSGDWNQWQAADSSLRLIRNQDRATISVSVPRGTALEFTFTRGAWTARESDAGGKPAPNRALVADESKTISVQLAGWTDLALAANAPTPTPNPLLENPYDDRVQRVQLLSRALGIQKTFFIYVPPQAATNRNERYPALFLLRGHEREWINPDEDASRGGTNVIDTYEELLAQGKIGPMVLVFPSTGSNDGVYNSMLTNMREPERTRGARGIGTGRFEDYFLQDLIPFVNENFPVLPDSKHRGVDGFSQGGFMAAKIATQHPDWFASVGAYDGLFFYAASQPITASVAATVTTPLTATAPLTNSAALVGLSLEDASFQNGVFDPVFGSPRDLKFAVANNPTTLLFSTPANALARLSWFIDYAPQALEPQNSNFYRGQYFVGLLAQRGLRNDGGVIANARHDWAGADAHMARVLPKHYAVLRP